MPHTIAEIEFAVRRVLADPLRATGDGLREQVNEFKILLEELWAVPGVESLNLRRMVRGFIDKADHHSRFAQQVA